MANPLARVVMSNVAQKSGKIDRRSSSSVNRAVRGKAKPNLGRQEKQILSSLLNDNASVKSTNASYDKNTYGRGSNVGSNTSKTIKTLDSLVSGISKKTEQRSRTENNAREDITRTQDSKRTCGVDKFKLNLRSLCSLDNVSVGSQGLESKSTSSRPVSRPVNKPVDNRPSNNRRDRDIINKLNLDDLARGKNTSTNSSVKRNVKTSTNNSSNGMTTLDQLAGNKSSNNQSKEKEVTKTVKSSVINNLEAYIPKVSLESIGKKGSVL